MNGELEFIIRTLLIGISATIIMDFWAILLKKFFNIPPLNWAMVGRWIGNVPSGKLIHTNISTATPISAELAIGWIAHYLIGIIFAASLIFIVGLEWARQPSFTPAILFGLITVIFPFFILQPGMGAGIAGSKTPNPKQMRIRSLAAHTVFGLGLYLSSLLLARLF